jgi:hypoxanthine-guanine phosphoribosyltransferase
VQAYDASVALVTSATNRDVYVMGVGLDLGQLLRKPSKLIP